MASRRRVLASAPICEAGSSPLPTTIWSIAWANRVVKASKIPSWTMKRVGEVHTWPALRVLPMRQVATALSRSASSNTSTGACPPSSSVQGFTWSAALRASRRPTAVEPVKVTLRITGDAIRWEDTSEGTPNTRFSTPAGRPASARAWASAMADQGVSSDGFITMEQPAARAGPILRAGSRAGKFQGVKAATGPSGCGRDSCRVPRTREGITRPFMRRASPAYQSRASALRLNSSLDSASVLPCATRRSQRPPRPGHRPGHPGWPVEPRPRPRRSPGCAPGRRRRLHRSAIGRQCIEAAP